MTGTMHVFWMIVVMAAVTFLIRAFPFMLFGRAQRPPEMVLYLGRVISPAAIAMLVVYCVKEVSVAEFPFGLPELIAGAVVVGLHVWRKNPLLSICSGTAVYMVHGNRVPCSRAPPPSVKRLNLFRIFRHGNRQFHRRIFRFVDVLRQHRCVPYDLLVLFLLFLLFHDNALLFLLRLIAVLHHSI